MAAGTWHRFDVTKDSNSRDYHGVGMNDQPSFLLPKKSKKIHCGKAAQSSSSAIDCPNRTLSCAHHVVLSPSSIKQESTRSTKIYTLGQTTLERDNQPEQAIATKFD